MSTPERILIAGRGVSVDQVREDLALQGFVLLLWSDVQILEGRSAINAQYEFYERSKPNPGGYMTAVRNGTRANLARAVANSGFVQEERRVLRDLGGMNSEEYVARIVVANTKELLRIVPEYAHPRAYGFYDEGELKASTGDRS